MGKGNNNYIGEMNTMEDKVLTCVECGKQFVFTQEEQEFFKEKGYLNSPKRCHECLKTRRSTRPQKRQSYEIVCSKCAKEASVPFLPIKGRELYCDNCFAQQRGK